MRATKRATKAASFRDSREYLAAELDWLDRALSLLLHLFHRREAKTEGQGLFLSQKEAERLLSQNPPADEPDAEALRASLDRSRREIVSRRKASLEEGVYLSLPHLAHLFHLSPVEETALLVSLAPELDPKYAKLYAYLQDDLTRKFPSVDLILTIARLQGAVGPQGRFFFSAQAPLLRWHLLHPAGEAGLPIPRLNQGLVLDERIVAFLLEIAQFDAKVLPYVQPLRRKERALPSPAAEVVSQLQGLITSQFQQQNAPRRKVLAYFYGPGAPDGRGIAEQLCETLKIHLIEVDLAALHQAGLAGALPFAEGLRRIVREALLQPAALYLSGFEKWREEGKGDISVMESLLREASWLTFIEGTEPRVPGAISEESLFLPFALSLPDAHRRIEGWRGLIDRAPTTIGKEEIESLSLRYRLTLREMEEAMCLARDRATLRSPAQAEVTCDDLLWACRERSQVHFGGLARSMTPRASWEDLVLPNPLLQQLREIVSQVRHRPQVLHDWGFEKKLLLGKGIYILFMGPSGTGKTLAAEVLAQMLGRDLLKVDLSAVVSKYIGETEKNLQRIFSGAERSDAILLFDEADALFGKRSEVKDAHDRYANIEVNYLLQRLEEYEGIVILATNFAQNIDDAFSRRIQMSIEFPFPNEASRLEIWKKHLPKEAPLAEGVDLEYLAGQFKIAGGNIRNIVLNAAFLAAEAGGPIQMVHLLQAIRREYEKMGKLFSESEFTLPPALATERAVPKRSAR
ncbi:ATP-binding protein [Candidatus Manganitrophus noduliformans]|uniref:ATP-binding protein n=1 Tax=Candidatus Manganitrophus noduliformans TaxID=2606439 RepID=A0A7X6DLT8_9BACT|nr:ATP-binding protein [Candidatus Manganitrophus noduliformans]NKE69583.1 ATP-binding protein [Candidatus Manganitrophus noduliformans]